MGDTAEDAAEDERSVELHTIQAIYPELVIDPSNRFSAQLDVPVEPLEPISVRFYNPNSGSFLPALTESLSTLSVGDGDAAPASQIVQQPLEAETDAPASVIHHLSYLPPLALHISLPDDYPGKQPPQISLHSGWLPPSYIKKIVKASPELWEDLGREQVVFAYVDYVREQAEKAFDLSTSGTRPLDISGDLQVALLDFDLKAKRAKFERETFECGVCLEPKKGAVCHRLMLCSHVFCVNCLQSFYTTCITEGDVGNVKCMAPKCDEEESKGSTGVAGPQVSKRKKDRTLEPNELLQIPLEQKLVQRYVKLKRKKRLESDPRTIYCPRQWCQGPARSERSQWKSQLDASLEDNGDNEAEPRTYDPNETKKYPPPPERLAICEDCSFAFCKVCHASWHGEYFSCFPRSQFELSAEDRASQDYLNLYTQGCPTCNARSQKTHGCNHMICSKCNTHFCYLCGAYLNSGNPYVHFNTKHMPCYLRLWELEAGDGVGVGHRFAGGFAGDESDEEFGFADDETDEEPEPPQQEQEPPPRQEAPALARAARARDVDRRPGQNQPRGAQRRPMPGNEDAGLQHFLQLVQNDQEDEWDSDEMEDGAEGLGDRWIG